MTTFTFTISSTALTSMRFPAFGCAGEAWPETMACIVATPLTAQFMPACQASAIPSQLSAAKRQQVMKDI